MTTRSRTKTEDIISAISTPPGEGGIGIVRLSGAGSIDLVASMFVSSTGRDIRRGRGRVFHGTIAGESGPIDEVLVHVMRAPHSYTREDVVEINAHGGAAPLNAILELALERGARLAQPGEFTKRAFLNGRIDLVQAEAVIDRIRAQTRAGLLAATNAADGVLSRTIHELTGVLRDALARIEAAVDFPEEDLPELVDAELLRSLEATRDRMKALLSTADAGRLYREGTTVAIAGRPNVGKSSLFNALLRESRAIVAALPGTTRDLVQEIINVGGVPVRLVDTAGLRESDDAIEKIGIEVARNALRGASMILFVVDGAAGIDDADRALAAEFASLKIPILLIINKIDLPQRDGGPLGCEVAAKAHVSAQTGEGLNALETTMHSMLTGGVALAPDQGLLTRAHQKDSLRRALLGVERVLENAEASPEFLAVDMHDALKALGEITGETTPDEILERIFASFCIGK